MDPKAYQPTQATDENGQDRGTFDSPFLAQGRAEVEANLGRSDGNWTFTSAESA